MRSHFGNVSFALGPTRAAVSVRALPASGMEKVAPGVASKCPAGGAEEALENRSPVAATLLSTQKPPSAVNRLGSLSTIAALKRAFGLTSLKLRSIVGHQVNPCANQDLHAPTGAAEGFCRAFLSHEWDSSPTAETPVISRLRPAALQAS